MSEVGTWVVMVEMKRIGNIYIYNIQIEILTDNWTSKSEIQEQDQC